MALLSFWSAAKIDLPSPKVRPGAMSVLAGLRDVSRQTGVGPLSMAFAWLRATMASPWELHGECEEAGWEAHASGRAYTDVPEHLFGAERRQWRHGWKLREDWCDAQW